VAIPALLALSAIHQHLVREGLRTTAGLVVETGSARGAPLRRAGRLRRRGRAPYLAMETLAAIHKDLPGELSRQGHLQLRQGDRQGPVQDHVQDGREHLHVLLRRPAVRGHRPEQRHGGQVLHRHRQPVEGIGVFEIAEEAIRNHRAAFGDDPVLATMLDAGGEYAWRARGEEHMWTPDAIAKLQHATRANNWTPTRNTPRSSTTRASAT
jgi:glutamate synthase (NADPH/NADH) large chain/glutamate synthase (ferredoxin)